MKRKYQLPKICDKLRVMKKNYDGAIEPVGAILTVTQVMTSGKIFTTRSNESNKEWIFLYPACFESGGLKYLPVTDPPTNVPKPKKLVPKPKKLDMELFIAQTLIAEALQIINEVAPYHKTWIRLAKATLAGTDNEIIE